jgi:hypothetical protein
VSNIEDFSAPQPEEASQDNRHQFEGVFDGMREAAKRTRNGVRIISFSCLAFGSARFGPGSPRRPNRGSSS